MEHAFPGSSSTSLASVDQPVLALLERIYGNGVSEHLKMPFIPHINASLRVAGHLRDRLTPDEHRKLVAIMLVHDLVMVYPDFAFPAEVTAVLSSLGVELSELNAISFKHLRDRFGHNRWDVIVPFYVEDLLAFGSEVCVLHALICWAGHVVFCVRNDNREYVANLRIMYAQFCAQLPAEKAQYRHPALIDALLEYFGLQLEIAEAAFDGAAEIRV